MIPYMVFFGQRGERTIVWQPERNPLGVFEADTPDEACQKASAYTGLMGAFFAVEGSFWGIRPDNVPKPFGQAQSSADRLDRLVDAMERRLALEAGPTVVESEGDQPTTKRRK